MIFSISTPRPPSD